MVTDHKSAERERIVAWLRDQEKRHALHASRKQTRQQELATLAMQGAYGFAAEAIERGDHDHQS